MKFRFFSMIVLLVASTSLFAKAPGTTLAESALPPIVPEDAPLSTSSDSLATQVLTERFWFTRGAMLGWSKGHSFPPFVRVPIATGPTVAAAENDSPGLFLQGAVGEAGMWLDSNKRHGFELGGSFVFQGGKRVGPDPFISTSDPTIGLFTSEARTRFFSLDSNYLRRLVDRPDLRVDVHLGYRYAYLSEDATVAIEIPTPLFALTRYNDRADSKNQFHGGQIGVSTRYVLRKWTLDATLKLAIGANITEGDLIGSSRALLLYTSTEANRSRQLEQLTQRETHFAIMPSFSTRVSQQLTEHGRMFLGYEFLYLSHVVRPDRILVGANAPTPGNWSRSTTDYWLHGLTAGMEWRY